MFQETHIAERSYGKLKIDFRKKFICKKKTGSHPILDSIFTINLLSRPQETRLKTLMMSKSEKNFLLAKKKLIFISK